MAHKVIDRRGTDQKTAEACRVCGGPNDHGAHYNKPTMQCVKYLRDQVSTLNLSIQRLEKQLAKA